MAIDKKPFWMSKSKWAGILTGIGIAMPGIIAWLNGGSFPLMGIYSAGIAVLAVFGIRDLPILNRK